MRWLSVERDMKMRLLTFRRTLTALVLSLLMLSVARPGQRTESSLTDSDIEISELKVAFGRIAGENRQLRDALTRAEAGIIEMQKTLAATDGEGEAFRRQALELKRRFEALGFSATGDTKHLERRFLAAVSDLQQVESDKKRLTEALIRLSEAVLQFSRTASSNDPESRLTLETEIRNASQALGLGSANAMEATPVSPTLTDAIVISVREELALVVANLGQKNGAKVGMPLIVTRDGRLIGNVRIVDVREKFTGAIIQNLSSEKDRIKVGDRLKVDTQQ